MKRLYSHSTPAPYGGAWENEENAYETRQPYEGRLFSFEEYQKLEAATEARLEFHAGQIWVMPGAKKRHWWVANTVANLLNLHFGEMGCEALSESVKLEIPRPRSHFYPDVVATCDPDDLSDPYFVRKPVFLAEVLSKASEGRDLGLKLRAYLKLPSLRYYLVLSQDEPEAFLYHRAAENAPWGVEVLEGMEAIVTLPLLGINFPLRRLYQRVKFGALGMAVAESDAPYGTGGQEAAAD